MVTAFRQVVAKEGVSALATGFGPTAVGYALQGAFKFGGYELWKKIAVDYVGFENAQANRQLIYLGASGIAEFFADVALCPLEATRIRLVSQPEFAPGLVSGFARLAREEGIGGFYAGCALLWGPLNQFRITNLTFHQLRSDLVQADSLYYGQIWCLRSCVGTS
jgi:solute carrier family 25 phosphate transporter 3